MKIWATPNEDRFEDQHGRQIILRGVNLGGDSKVPYPDGGTEIPSDFADHRDVSFIGRPFPLAQADEHFARLRAWGFNCLRLLTTWEAVEHGGAGLYDQDYLDFYSEICERAASYGMHIFVDFHQDVWSRMTGGDGAPGWLFDALGMDFTRFHDADVVHLMQRKFDYESTCGRQPAYPQMSWGTNYRLPVNGIMWSLFWCGSQLTPDFLIDGQNVQTFLQGHYLGAMNEVAKRVAHLPNVIGFDTLNEPGTGFIGQPMSYRHTQSTQYDPSHPRQGICLSPADSLAIARGISTVAPVLARNDVTGAIEECEQRTINSKQIRIWKGDCPFERAGAYKMTGDQLQILNEDFFRVAAGSTLEMSEAGYKPFFFKVADTIRPHNPDWAVFAELDPFGVSGGRIFPRNMPSNTVNATHWYDRATLFRKSFDSTDHLDMATGQRETSMDQIRDRYVKELKRRQSGPMGFAQPAPTVIGEFGIPYDLHDGEAYEAWASGRRDSKVWERHNEVLSLMYDALDELHLHSTQWNYTASNRNDLRIGDRWNQEDLSIFSMDQVEDASDPDSGGRAIDGFCRPYVQASQGLLEWVRYNYKSGDFDCQVHLDPLIAAPTLIYIPKNRYRFGYDLQIDNGQNLEVHQSDHLISILSGRDGPLHVTVRSKAASSDQ